jgi:tRNA modification GTPase
MSKTIAAISTPNASGGISVIRISGEDAFSVADMVFRTKSGITAKEMQGYSCAYGSVFGRDGFLDEAVMTVFREPKSFTGENVVEISVHGGIFLSRQILREIISFGAALAEAGEFTKRAFLNGKLELTQAEAVMDIISAKSMTELKYANALHNGALFRRIKQISGNIISVLGDLSAWADFPEEDIPEVKPEVLADKMQDIENNLAELISTYDYGRIIREGINTVIAGKPNVGKSTLMNCLSGFERSIVTETAGTTRDIIEENVRIGEFVLRLSDTAGIRETGDKIEKMGIDFALRRIDEADLIIAVFDNSEPLSDEDERLLSLISDRKSIAVINKTDRESVLDKAYICGKVKYCVEMSAKNSSGIDMLKECLEEMFNSGDISPDCGIVANERQKSCLEGAFSSVKEAISALENGECYDVLSVLLDSAAEELLKLTGEAVSESVVNEVFSRFCVGK